MSSRASGIVVGILGVLLLGLAIFTVLTVSGLNSDIDDLEGETAALGSTTSALKSSTASGGEDLAKELKGLELNLKKIRDCIPEIQNEINGLSVEVENGYAYIENNSQVSSYCSPVVYPNTAQGE